MRTISNALVLAAILWSSGATSGELSSEELEKSCAQKTIVYGYDENRKIIKIGESIDGFCAGFIRATFESFSTTDKCQAAGDDPNFLLSVYSQYMKERSTSTINLSAFENLLLAFTRIPDCATSNPLKSS